MSHICQRYAVNFDATIASIASLIQSSQAVSSRANIHLARISHSPEHYPVNVRFSPHSIPLKIRFHVTVFGLTRLFGMPPLPLPPPSGSLTSMPISFPRSRRALRCARRYSHTATLLMAVRSSARLLWRLFQPDREYPCPSTYRSSIQTLATLRLMPSTLGLKRLMAQRSIGSFSATPA